jgi:hypothetical protein
MRCAPTRASRILSVGSDFRPESERQVSLLQDLSFSGLKCRRGKHPIQPHGFGHRIHHSPKAGLHSSVLVQYITRITSSYSGETIGSIPETGLKPRRDSIMYCLSRLPAEKIATPFTSCDRFTSAKASAPAPSASCAPVPGARLTSDRSASRPQIYRQYSLLACACY